MQTMDVAIEVDYVQLEGTLSVPHDASAIIVFVHGSGSSRFSPRNRQTAKALQKAGMATLLFDLLTRGEQEHDNVTAEYRFNIPLLTRRLVGTLGWLRGQSLVDALPIGLFGASTGAAAALAASAEIPKVLAIVSRGGRPDLAREALPSVVAPTLLIVGELDEEVIRLNRKAAEQMACEHEIVIVQGATHLFEEPGKLELVERLAVQWFASKLADGRTH
ncbi:alpha/beta hydrolase [Paraburkholderia sp. UYCP14C]|uniref:dienelactone hydrolase family protein n=1 Tax=Paraburkholderia sp. UYCP14C TaxID=2511130 RepID=UPI001021AE54|nr:dienelactone hydrolase family protein [Paraburkholderia sp. UYCP14C]RZF25661.1 alpha/beta hydrolase [Paraburkholderia sp. UYCP14C]